METIREKIFRDPYLKIGNCTDASDLQYAVDRINELRELFPNSKLLKNMYFKFEHKRMKLTEQI